MTGPRPSEGGQYFLDGLDGDVRVVRVTAINDEAQTACVVYADTAQGSYEGDRAHGLPWSVLGGQEWACDYTEDEPG